MESIKILRSAVGCVAGIEFIETLKQNGIDVIGIDANPLSVGFLKTKPHYVVPKGTSTKFIPELIKIIKKENPSAIISGPEEEIIQLSKHKATIESLGCLTFVPEPEIVEIFTNKENTNSFFRNNGFLVPKQFKKNKLTPKTFPVIIKPKKGRGGKGIKLIKKMAEMPDFDATTHVIEEYLKGEEYSIDVFNDLNGKNLSIVPRIRLKTDSGISTIGITKNDIEIISHVKRLLTLVKLPGASCVQGFKTKQGFIFTEINLRFGGGSILSIKADPSILTNLIKILKNEKPITSTKFKENLMMFRHFKNDFIEKSKMGEFFD